MMRLSNIADAINAELIGADQLLENVVIDSRKNTENGLYVALKGERFDGHDFIAEAHKRGAIAAMVEDETADSLSQLKVIDCHQSLKQLAAWWRSQFAVPVIAVTGSVGKTSVKEMLAAIFAQLGEGISTEGNFNNEIGLPLTVMRLKQQHLYMVLEMGMNHAGEISRLSEIARPTVALITNAGAAHLEGLGSVEAVAKAKGEIFEFLAADGTAVINADDAYCELWKELAAPRKVITFGLENDADVKAEYQLFVDHAKLQVTTSSNQNFEFSLPMTGKHAVMNALSAIAVALAAHIPVEMIQQGLAQTPIVNGRMQTTELGALTLINDTYNANPVSTRAAIDVLAKHQPSMLIIGEMGELGSFAEQGHFEVGEYAAQYGVQQLLACGKYASSIAKGFGSDAECFADNHQLIEYLKNNMPTSGAVLVKGSRSAKMEEVVNFIQQQMHTEGVAS